MSSAQALHIAAMAVMVLAWSCFLVVLARNLVSGVQLAVAAWVFWTRIEPAPRAIDLWSRSVDLAPPISVIAPAYNEELSITQSVRALLALEYPEHEIIVVNDGSKDATLATLIRDFELEPSDRPQIAALQRTKILGVYRSRVHRNLLVVDKENGRKADAVNMGIGFARTPLVCVIDADSIIETDGLLRAAEPFMTDDGSLLAVGGAIRIVNGCEVRGGSLRKIGIPREWIARFQVIEYFRAFLTARVANAHFNSLLLISGAFGLFRRSALVEIGGYRHDTVGEDLELVVRLHRYSLERNIPYRIGFVPEIVCWTEAPVSMLGLKNQRSRWQQGALETLEAHRGILFNPRYGRIGMLATPQMLVEDVIGPPAEVIGYLVVPAAWALGLLSGQMALAFLALTVAFGTGLSIATLALEEAQLRRTPSAADLLKIAAAALLENFGFRQANLVFRLVGIKRHLKRETGWSAVPRTGFS
ncbi:glycosyl transferase [Erythrobacter sp. SG61-1L]|uniref:glycosyltransferase family 2 protein n=1 Tax=Erythrobacter sp. SG61-1L TaxID=1603897 RepID=UPI0006C934CF|nr:glycosyltransferase family 2 protein [Erythrobacter sp. SG61-1L]KPL68673.1 glycosyl transferase [Erythrobacter sp. SG61-1L]